MVEARPPLVQGLRSAEELRSFGAAIQVLPAAAQLRAEGGSERAAALYAQARRYGSVANSRWFEDVAGRRIAQVANTLPAEDAAAARARGQARDLWERVEELLGELGGLGPQPCPALPGA